MKFAQVTVSAFSRLADMELVIKFSVQNAKSQLVQKHKILISE